MAIPEAPIPGVLLDQIVRALRDETAATLTAAIVTASGKPHSIEQVLEIMQDIQWSRTPNPGNGVYEAWLRTKDARLKKVHGA